jgi:hypothetical protein
MKSPGLISHKMLFRCKMSWLESSNGEECKEVMDKML